MNQFYNKNCQEAAIWVWENMEKLHIGYTSKQIMECSKKTIDTYIKSTTNASDKKYWKDAKEQLNIYNDY